MKLVRNIVRYAKQIKFIGWLAAAIFPGGLVVMGIWLIAKGVNKTMRSRK